MIVHRLSKKEANVQRICYVKLLCKTSKRIAFLSKQKLQRKALFHDVLNRVHKSGHP